MLVLHEKRAIVTGCHFYFVVVISGFEGTRLQITAVAVH